MTPTMLDIALDCIARGWHVFPCKPASKEPMTRHGWKDASADEAQLLAWWNNEPDANVAIATLFSGLTVWDCDKGFACLEDFNAWARCHALPETYLVRSGRRDYYGVQAYFTGDQIPSRKWELDGCSGDFRSNTGYVMAAGSVHPITRERYELIADTPLAPLPDFLRVLKRELPPLDLKGDGELDALREALDKHGINYEDQGNKLWVSCPWAHEHSMYSGPSEAALFVKNGVYCFKCHHSSCDGRSYSQYRIEAVK